MLFYQEIERWEEPASILGKVEYAERATLMNPNDLSFLCGVIRAFKPKKIVEIGIAYGGTTAVIANSLSKLNYECEMHSIDILEAFRGKTAGYYLNDVQEYIDMTKIKHTFHLGNVAPAFLDEIGNNIDMLILDTAHGLPGELLEFITCFPYLSKDAVVVLHDVVDHCTWRENMGMEYATQLLYDTVVADKYMNPDEERSVSYPNIAAFRINEDTKKYIGNCFGAMTMTWLYMPDEEQYNLYKECVAKHYTEEYVQMLDKAKVLNDIAFVRKVKRTQKFMSKLLNGQLYIYGAGKIGKKCKMFLQQYKIEPIGFVISDNQEKVMDEIEGIPVYKLNEIKDNRNCFVLAVNNLFMPAVKANLKENGIEQYVEMQELEMIF